ncbi:MAG: zinc ribbon domain-containing protein [Anaerolineales bacterium]|nr:zinc ribbon domain-containing protein [Anaerolineales bacterium]
MKRTLFLLILLLFLPTTLVQAQTAVSLQSLNVELWPDYDQEAVLVLLTGTLPASQALPVTLTIPLPDGADFHVAARITPDNVMSDQGMSPTVGDNEVTFSLSESRFRVEYYQPYTANNTQRNFSFSWQSDTISVDDLTVTLQQPFDTMQINTVPNASNVAEGQDGLTYHTFAGQAVPAGDVYTVDVDYTLNSGALTVDFEIEDTATNTDLPFLDAVPVEESGFDWQLLLVGLGVLIIIGSAAWYFFSNRPNNKRPAKPKPRRDTKPTMRETAVAHPTPKGKANFCHQCGESLQASDKFCRNCGTAVKQK